MRVTDCFGVEMASFSRHLHFWADIDGSSPEIASILPKNRFRTLKYLSSPQIPPLVRNSAEAGIAGCQNSGARAKSAKRASHPIHLLH
jgi:hypothetical protein